MPVSLPLPNPLAIAFVSVVVGLPRIVRIRRVAGGSRLHLLPVGRIYLADSAVTLLASATQGRLVECAYDLSAGAHGSRQRGIVEGVHDRIDHALALERDANLALATNH